MKKLFILFFIAGLLYGQAGWKTKTASSGLTSNQIVVLAQDSTGWQRIGATIRTIAGVDSVCISGKLRTDTLYVTWAFIDTNYVTIDSSIVMKAATVICDSLNLENGQVIYDPGTNKLTVADLVATTADINGGTIDGTIIGGNSAAAGTFTTLKSDSANISGDLVVDGTENHVTATDLRATTIGAGVSTTATSVLEVQKNGIAATQGNAYGLTLRNTTAALTGERIQYSPPIIFDSNVWETTGSTSQNVKWRFQQVPVTGATATSQVNLNYSFNNSAYQTIVPYQFTPNGLYIGGPTTPTGMLHLNGNNVELALENPTAETVDGGRDTYIKAYGMTAASARHSLGYIKFDLFGATTNRGRISFNVNDGDDGLTPSKTILSCYATSAIGLSSVFTGLVGIGVNPVYTLDVINTTATPANIAYNSSTTNSILPVLRIERTTAGTAAAGIGGSIDTYLENSAGTSESASIVSTEYTNATDGSEAGQITFRTRAGGVDLTTAGVPQVTITGNGSIMYNNITKMAGGSKTLVDGVATAICSIALPTLSQTGGAIDYTIYASDAGVDTMITYSGKVCFSASNKAAAYVSDIKEVTTNSLIISNPAGATMTDDWTITTGTNLINILVNANPVIDAGYTLTIKYNLILNDSALITRL